MLVLSVNAVEEQHDVGDAMTAFLVGNLSADQQKVLGDVTMGYGQAIAYYHMTIRWQTAMFERHYLNG